MYMCDVCTVPINLAGLCGMVVPFKMLNGLPLGLQLIGAPFGEMKLFQAAASLARTAGPLPKPAICGKEAE